MMNTLLAAAKSCAASFTRNSPDRTGGRDDCFFIAASTRHRLKNVPRQPRAFAHSPGIGPDRPGMKTRFGTTRVLVWGSSHEDPILSAQPRRQRLWWRSPIGMLWSRPRKDCASPLYEASGLLGWNTSGDEERLYHHRGPLIGRCPPTMLVSTRRKEPAVKSTFSCHRISVFRFLLSGRSISFTLSFAFPASPHHWLGICQIAPSSNRTSTADRLPALALQSCHSFCTVS